MLRQGNALEMVVLAVQRLEDDPLFNAGTGSVLQRDGMARMSAAVMDGSRLRCAGVLNIQRVKNPVLVAQTLLDRSDGRVLAGPEAVRYARSLGHRPWNPVTPERLRQWSHALRLAAGRLSRLKAERSLSVTPQGVGWRAQRVLSHGTVGAVALDGEGRLAAATSSGGRSMAWPGRVSDSGLPVGNYANTRVAISCTGHGEDIIDEGLAVRIAQRMIDGASLSHAFRRTFRELTQRARQAAAIGVDSTGRLTWASTVPALYALGRTAGRFVEAF